MSAPQTDYRLSGKPIRQGAYYRERNADHSWSYTARPDKLNPLRFELRGAPHVEQG